MGQYILNEDGARILVVARILDVPPPAEQPQADKDSAEEINPDAEVNDDE